MTVDFMRTVDRYVGIPACLLLSFVHRLNPFTARTKPSSVKKILFLQISEMGSAISAYSALRKAQAMFPDAELYYFIFSEMQESVHLLNIIPRERVLTVTSKSFFGFIGGLLRMIVTIRRMRFDAILDLELFSRLSSLLSFLFGARYRAGFYRFHMEGLYRGTMQTHRVVYNHTRHISENFLALVYALAEAPGREPLSKVCIDENDIVRPRIPITPAGRRHIGDLLRRVCPSITPRHRIVLFNPNASELLPLRRWPMENYIALAKRLVRDARVIVAVTGAPSEARDADAIVAGVANERCVSLAGKTTLRELVDLYHCSHVLLSNDSGPPNFASLTPIRVLVFFGPETPLCYKPLGNQIEALYSSFACSPCVSAYNHRKSACTDNRCLQAITVDEVYRRVTGALKRS